MTKNSGRGSDPLGRLVGTWTTEATHPATPGVVVRGTAAVERLEGGRFLTLRTRTEHPDFPDSLSSIGNTGQDRVGGADGNTIDGRSQLCEDDANWTDDLPTTHRRLRSPAERAPEPGR